MVTAGLIASETLGIGKSKEIWMPWDHTEEDIDTFFKKFSFKSSLTYFTFLSFTSRGTTRTYVYVPEGQHVVALQEAVLGIGLLEQLQLLLNGLLFAIGSARVEHPSHGLFDLVHKVLVRSCSSGWHFWF